MIAGSAFAARLIHVAPVDCWRDLCEGLPYHYGSGAGETKKANAAARADEKLVLQHSGNFSPGQIFEWFVVFVVT
jgi:hypothetical protein